MDRQTCCLTLRVADSSCKPIYLIYDDDDDDDDTAASGIISRLKHEGSSYQSTGVDFAFPVKQQFGRSDVAAVCSHMQRSQVVLA